MRIGIDAHIVLPKHKRFDARIARYTENLIQHLIEQDKKKEHTWVLFFDSRMKNTKKFEQENVEIHHFPFVHYRQYLPVVYSHMLISGFLTSARLDIFHSPEGLIPFMYPGKIITTFHYVPRGERDSGLFVRTFMLGARAAFAQLCKRAKRIIVNKRSDKAILVEKHGYPDERVVVMEEEDLEQVDWPKRVRQLMKLYKEVALKKVKAPAKKKAASKK
ncbi:MAG: glycosyltransferase [Candidatus Andersenbacteria bacterium]